jgi:tetratricopeptide (TPR) repeat protein
MPLSIRPVILLASIAATALLCACGSIPPSQPATPARADPTQMVAAVRAAAGSGEGELAVQPLRDPMVEDLRQQAVTLEQQQRYADAAAALDKALAITPDDPAVLQERAEAALLLKDFDGAEQRARRAYDIGAKVGPLCRRHWATVRAVRYAANDGAGAAEANRQLAACKVAALERF